MNNKRTANERFTDKLLLMRLIQLAQKKGRLVTIPLHKLAFLSQNSMTEKDMKGFNYTFFRDQFGPAAPGIYEDFPELIDSGLIEDCPFRLTKDGEALVKGLEPAFQRSQNKDISETIDEVVRTTPIDTPGIKQKVYNMVIKLPSGKRMKVSDIPYTPKKKILILQKMPDRAVRTRFHLTEDEMEILEMSFDPELCKSIKCAGDDAKKGRIRPFSPV